MPAGYKHISGAAIIAHRPLNPIGTDRLIFEDPSIHEPRHMLLQTRTAASMMELITLEERIGFIEFTNTA